MTTAIAPAKPPQRQDSCRVPIEDIHVSAYRIPTASLESDATLAWDGTTLVLVQVQAGGHVGIGATYADRATAQLIQEHFVSLLTDANVLDTRACWLRMVDAVRNLGRPGVCSMAISAVDLALWDIKGKLLKAPVAVLLGAVREQVPIYGSGGFTTYSDERLTDQIVGWREQGIDRVKIKIGRHPEDDVQRVQSARAALATGGKLFVDANGGYNAKQALHLAQQFAQYGVTWLEEPVSSDDLDGLRLMRERAPAGMNITAGEYGYDLTYFHRMLNAQAVDVLQADATRCGGITGFLAVDALCQAHHIPLSSHTAPAFHLQAALAATSLVHGEYFFDHVRIEQMLFDSGTTLADGCLWPDWRRPGLGLEFKFTNARRFEI